jgi:hypothetical protein
MGTKGSGRVIRLKDVFYSPDIGGACFSLSSQILLDVEPVYCGNLAQLQVMEAARGR